MATWKTLTNDVLIRMREDQITTVTENAYSTMIGAFINDAKEIVEAAWDWSALRNKITFNTVQSTTNYTLTGSQDRFKVITALNDTGNTDMILRSGAWFDRQQQLNSTTPESTPSYYTFRGKDSSNDLTVDLFPVPDGVYTINFNGIKPQAVLATEATVILVPAQPVKQLALAMAVRERGETGGTAALEYFEIADIYLADEIALDIARHPSELDWYPS
jgi:hypothetical protein